MPIRGGGSIIQHTDDAITRESIEKISKKDADAYFAFYEWVGHIADIMGPIAHADAAAPRLDGSSAT